MCAKVYKGKSLDDASQHACIRVRIDDKDYYVDTGFGEGVIMTPLPLNSKQFIQTEGGLVFRQKRPCLLIDTKPVTFSHFIPRILYHQTDSSSWFKNNLTLMIATESSQHILLNSTYTIKTKTSKSTRIIHTSEELHTLISSVFNIDISSETSTSLFCKIQNFN